MTFGTEPCPRKGIRSKKAMSGGGRTWLQGLPALRLLAEEYRINIKVTRDRKLLKRHGFSPLPRTERAVPAFRDFPVRGRERPRCGRIVFGASVFLRQKSAFPPQREHGPYGKRGGRHALSSPGSASAAAEDAALPCRAFVRKNFSGASPRNARAAARPREERGRIRRKTARSAPYSVSRNARNRPSAWRPAQA